MEHTIEAQVIDSSHLKLRKPIKIAPGSTVMITIEIAEVGAEGVAENQDWYLLSSSSLEEAYGLDEPDYSLDTIKVPNPDYRP